MELRNKIFQGDALSVLKQFPDDIIDCVITSPPYWNLRDYGVDGQLGLEKTFNEYLEKLWEIFDEVYRVLKKEGTCWVNLGDTYSGSSCGNSDPKNKNVNTKEFKKEKMINIKDKSLCMIPERFAVGMIDRGWILRNQIIWYKLNQMPSPVTDRFTVDFEKVFFFTKSKKYYFNQQFEDMKNESFSRYKCTFGTHKSKGEKKVNNIVGNRDISNLVKRNKRTVWGISTQSFSESHFAVFPEKLIQTPILSGCPENGIVLDIFMGAGTTALVSLKLDRNYCGIELNEKYIEIIEKRIKSEKRLVKKRLFTNSGLNKKDTKDA